MKTTKQKLAAEVSDLKHELAFERKAFQDLKQQATEFASRINQLNAELAAAHRQIANLKRAVQQLGDVIAHI